MELESTREEVEVLLEWLPLTSTIAGSSPRRIADSSSATSMPSIISIYD